MQSIELIKQQVGEAYKFCREGRLLELSTSPLAYTSLVEATFISGVPVSADVRGHALQSVLRWSADKLRPSGAHSWLANNWRAWNTIHHFYLAGMRVAELAERMAIAEQTLYHIRSEALTAVARVLIEEHNKPRDLAGRKHYAITERYNLHNEQQQMILRLLAAFQQAMPDKLLHSLATQSGIVDPQSIIHPLVAANWIVTNDSGTELLLHPDVSRDILTRLLPDERRTWHRAIGQWFLGRRSYFEAARHLHGGDQAEQAAHVLIEHYQDIVNNLQLDDMMRLISRFDAAELENNTWARLKIASGDAAVVLEDIDSAVSAYQQALSAQDVMIKALAYYRRAKALMQRNLDESLAHFAYCVRLLEAQTSAEAQHLLIQVYIDRALIYLEERPAQKKARHDLERASQLIPHDERAMSADLHTAWLRLTSMSNEWNDAIEHGQMAWLAANELQDATRMVRTSHNLGMTYARLGRFPDARPYLQRSLDLALETGNRPHAGLNHKTIGGGLFMIGETEQAIEHYLQAHELFMAVGRENWLAHTCYDLAEAYVKLGDVANVQKFYGEGLRLANQLGDDRLQEEFATFGQNNNSLLARVSSRQLVALDQVQKTGKITNRQYQQMNGVSARQALRDLQELEEAGLLIKAGKGRSTHYRSPSIEST